MVPTPTNADAIWKECDLEKKLAEVGDMSWVGEGS